MNNRIKAIIPTNKLIMLIEYDPKLTYNSPKTVSKPSTPPLIFPASYEAFPTTIAANISNVIKCLKKGILISSRITSDSPFCEMIPNLAAISCKIMVAKIESTIAHNKLKPKFTPAIVHKVTVPGPIKAAAINVPGPIFLN